MSPTKLAEKLASSLLEGSPCAGAEEAALKALGFINPRGAWENLKALTEKGGFPGEDSGFLKELLLAVADSFEPDRALNNLERLAESLREPGELFRALGERSSREALLALFSGSQHLTDVLLQEPGYLAWLLEPSVLDASKTKEEMARELRGLLSEAGNHAERLAALRRFRKREFLRIGARDLTRRADLLETTADISHLADVCLEGAYESCYRELKRTHGAPRFPGPDGEEQECEFTVLAMGKLGGEELNFSSDIDILFLYSSDEGGTEGVEIEGLGRHQQLTNHDFFVRLSQMLTAAMSEITEEGALFRVDLRLRPEGQSGDIAYSLRSYEIYYESWGQTWERQAMLKVRPAAGSMSLGESFVQMIQPFVYRKHLDFAALDEIRAMKERIDRDLLK
ncbi:MAG: glutamate-ammonia-ligase adenylyltransferase, partial [Nitrospinota bacterium]